MPDITNTTTIDPANKHLLYDTFSPAWQAQMNFAEMHEHILRDGTYLDEFGKDSEVREKAGQYTWRKQQSFAMDYCADLIDLRIGNLFRTPPVRHYDDSPFKDFIDQFIADVDNGGTPIDDFMAEAVRKHYTLGVDLVCDSEAAPDDALVINRAQERELGLRPYWSMFTPLERMYWDCNHAGYYNWVRYDLGTQPTARPEDGSSTVHQYIEYLPGEWRLYTVAGGTSGKKTITVERGGNAIGRMPVVPFYWRRSMRAEYRGIPISLLTRVAPIARTMLNLVSQGQIDLYLAIGILLATGVEPTELPEALSPMCFVAFRNADASITHVSPNVENIVEKREWLMMMAEAILRMGKVIGATGDVKGRATSGFQVQAERTDLDNEMATTAGQLERVETQMMALAISRNQGKWISPSDIGYSVDYNRKYVLTPLNDILDQAKKAFDLNIEDSTPDLLRVFLRRALDSAIKPTDPRYVEIADQIENADLSLVGASSMPKGLFADKTAQDDSGGGNEKDQG